MFIYTSCLQLCYVYFCCDCVRRDVISTAHPLRMFWENTVKLQWLELSSQKLAYIILTPINPAFM